jgi:quercetin dioxygenase-like cupin family protein
MTGVRLVDFQMAEGPDRGCVYETDDIQVMRIRLAAREALPHHNSNSNVLLVPLAGRIQLSTQDGDEVIGVGESLSLPYDTPMDVSNSGDDTAVFLVLKTPHPKTFK